MKKWLIIDSGCKPSRVHGTGYAALSPRHSVKMVLEQLVPKFQVETFISVGTLPVGLYKLQLLDANSSIVANTSLIKQ